MFFNFLYVEFDYLPSQMSCKSIILAWTIVFPSSGNCQNILLCKPIVVRPNIHTRATAIESPSSDTVVRRRGGHQSSYTIFQVPDHVICIIKVDNTKRSNYSTLIYYSNINYIVKF